MKINLIIAFVFILFANACKDPSSVDANRDITTIFDPNNLPPVFVIDPEVIDFGIVHPNTNTNKDFLISNISSKSVDIKKMQAKIFGDNYKFYSEIPFSLAAKSNSGSSKSIGISFTSDTPGKYFDKIDWSEYKNPTTIITAKVASVWADDISFDLTKVGNFNLKFLKIFNSSSSTATITEFTILDSNSVIINEPRVSLPLVIGPKSESKDILLTFYPKDAKIFYPEIRIKAIYSEGEHFTDEIINLVGRGSN